LRPPPGSSQNIAPLSMSTTFNSSTQFIQLMKQTRDD
jgi:hypothetical protein